MPRKYSKQMHSRYGGFASLIIILVGLFLLSPNITGNAVGTTSTIGNLVGGILLGIGLVIAFLFFRKS